MSDRRAVSLILTDPLTWAAGVITLVAVGVFFWWFQPDLTMAANVLGVGAILLLAWPALLVRSARYAARIESGNEELELGSEADLIALETELRDLGTEQGVAQLRMLREKYDNLADVLGAKLNTGEVTYARYLAMAKQVYLSGLDSLKEAAVSLKSISKIDPSYAISRLDELKKSTFDAAGKDERDALSRRLSLFDEQNARVARLLAQNESALTVLDRTAAAIAEARTGEGRASLDAKTAIAELEDLAKRAGKYAVQ
jgi:hypothetical protein